jgi:predicted metal-dependent phosphoesterase TrpH
MLADLHVHAPPASGDAYDSIERVAHACEALGVEAIALTDHGPGCDYASAENVMRTRGITLVPGRELSTPLGHVLVLTTDVEWLVTTPEVSPLPLPSPPSRRFALVWAHPAGWRVAGAMAPPDPSRGAEHVHAIEVLNGERLYQSDGVAIAAQLATSLGKAQTGGSDAHRAHAAGKCLTEVDGADDAQSFIDGIRGGYARPVLWPEWAAAHRMVYERADLVAYLPSR